MHVWLFKAGENFPFQENLRKMRTGMLAAQLVARGHTVLWWSTNFHHQTKTVLFPDEHEVRMGPSYTIKLLKGIPYKRNVSLKRWLNYKQVARRVRECVNHYKLPDVIVTAMPSYDVGHEFVVFGRQHGIPVLVDVRDSWPDSFLDQLPSWARGLARIVLSDDFRRLDTLLNQADAVLASSSGLMEWAFSHIEREPGPQDCVICHGYPRPPRKVSRNSLPATLIELVDRMRSRFTLTFVGTFGQAYDLEIILDAAKRFQEEGHDELYFVLAGIGDQYDRLVHRARGISNVALPGWLQGQEITHLLRASKVGLTTYKDVNFFLPNKAFEYFAHGLPILSSLPGELETLLERESIGRTYQPGSLDQFCEHILDLYRHPELLKTFSRNALRVFDEKYEENRIYSDYVDRVEQAVRDRVSQSFSS